MKRSWKDYEQLPEGTLFGKIARRSLAPIFSCLIAWHVAPYSFQYGMALAC